MKHDQRPDPTQMVCSRCKSGKCAECMDVLRSAYSSVPLCKCRKKDHPDPMGVRSNA
jgi:hypothetical protein